MYCITKAWYKIHVLMMIFTVNDTDTLGGKKELQALPKGSHVCSFHQLSSFVKFNYL